MADPQTNGSTDFDAAKIATTVTKHDEEFISVTGAIILLLVGAVLYALAAKYIH